MMTPDLVWEIPQTVDTIDPKSSHYDPASAYAKTLLRDGVNWGVVPKTDCPRKLAHDNSNINCEVCHTSWATSCFGCHLPMRANERVALNKYEGINTRNFTSYNPEVVRDDVFQLGIDATYKDHRLAVIRSSSAVLVSSQNANREWVYSQQQTVSAEGFSGQAFNPAFLHTTSGVGTTKNCEDCHLSDANDNNAWMASLLGFGTGTVNFFGRFAYVGEGRGGLDAVAWTEQEEPQAAYGSHLQRLAYPDDYRKFTIENHGELKEAYHEDADDILDLQLRGEYLYTANGAGGFRVFDVANIDNKGFSQRITSAPASPLGQSTYVPTKFATSVTLPSTLADDPLRTHRPENEEQAVSPIYAWVFVTDREEGLVMVTVGTLLDGDPANNFFSREKIIRFNPGGKLTGAMDSFMAGTNLYVVGQNGLFVVGLRNDSLAAPALAGEVTSGLKNPRAVSVQFRYLFVTDDEGFKVFDITEPTKPRLIPGAFVPLKHAQRFYLARTYACVADGADGLAFIDITNPEKPRLERLYNAGGQLTDTRAVQVGSISASEFALVADGRNGLRVIQLISPENVPGAAGFSPVPNPKLIATFATREPAVAVSRGLDRDRVVDESGNQTVVFGRRGSRPFHLDEMQRFYERDGRIYTVENISTRGGGLVTRSGRELNPTEPFQPLAEETETPGPPPETERLMRQGE